MPSSAATSPTIPRDACDADARAVLQAWAGAELDDWPQAAAGLRTIALRAGETLFRDGEPHPFVYVVRSGLLKLVYGTPDGKEWIKSFAHEGLMFASITALQPGGVASFSAVAIGATRVDRFEHAALAALAARHLPWQRLLGRAFEVYGARKEKRERELLVLSAEQRYLQFLADHPGLDARIAQKDLAAYLRITPVALSRIKARLRRAPGAAQ